MRTLLTAGLFALLSGCYSVKYYNPDTTYDRRGETHQQWVHSLFWGSVSLGKVNLGACGDRGIKHMKSRIGGLGLIAYALTGGIWTPMNVKFVCARPKQAGVDEVEAGGGTVSP